MLFNSFEFAIFFPIVTLLYFVLPYRLRIPMLLAASCWFYMAFVPKYILILAVLILIDYAAGLLIEPAMGRKRHLLLVVSLCANVGMLAFFKYFNFLNANLEALAHFIGWNYSISALSIVLPIGLSFHTFQSMSYTIEVYKGRFPAERSLVRFATYVMFYPQLVAGPIERPQNLLHQFHENHDWSWTAFIEGAQLMLAGFFRKVVIADRAAVLVNAVYANPSKFSGAELFTATCFFAIQIYCDFAGYSEIARGAARMMGFRLMQNFNSPYLATNIVEFWRRWHMSLSTWFRDYVYFPLGGNRVNQARLCFNLAAVFLISGLWHGANWTFIIWGALHAAYMVTYVITTGARASMLASLKGAARSIYTGMSWLLTMILVCIAWVFFRAATVTDSLAVIGRIFTAFRPAGSWTLHPGMTDEQFVLSLVLIAGMFAIEILGRRAPVWSMVDAQPKWRKWGVYYAFGLIFVVALLFSPDTKPQPFIYFQF